MALISFSASGEASFSKEGGWVFWEEGSPLPSPKPSQNKIYVPWNCFSQERTRFLEAGVRGVFFPNDADPSLLKEDLERLEMIALEFPIFRDGRAYSQARMLRQQMGFSGDLRATGDVLRDQIFFMTRCGFSSFEVSEKADFSQWKEALKEFSAWYQPAISKQEAMTIWQRRSGAPSGGGKKKKGRKP